MLSSSFSVRPLNIEYTIINMKASTGVLIVSKTATDNMGDNSISPIVATSAHSSSGNKKRSWFQTSIVRFKSESKRKSTVKTVSRHDCITVTDHRRKRGIDLVKKRNSSSMHNQSMDHATFSTIIKIQRQEFAEYRRNRVPSKLQLDQTAAWKAVWKEGQSNDENKKK